MRRLTRNQPKWEVSVPVVEVLELILWESKTHVILKDMALRGGAFWRKKGSRLAGFRKAAGKRKFIRTEGGGKALSTRFLGSADRFRKRCVTQGERRGTPEVAGIVAHISRMYKRD